MTSSYFVEILFDCEKENKFSFSNHHNISKLRLRLNFLVNLVSREGREPSTPGLKGPCSNLLSYRPRFLIYISELEFRMNILVDNGGGDVIG